MPYERLYEAFRWQVPERCVTGDRAYRDDDGYV